MNILLFLKSSYYSLMGWLASILLYFFPIKELAIAIGIAFIINFSFGIFVGVVIQREGVKFKKAMFAFYEVAVYLVIFTTMFAVSDRMKCYQSALMAMKVLTWAWLYFYASNWSKNLKRIFPDSRGIAFFYFLLNLEFLKNIPFLKKFEEYENKGLKKD